MQLYLKREKNVSEICKELKISPKRLCKIINRKGIKLKKHNLTK